MAKHIERKQAGTVPRSIDFRTTIHIQRVIQRTMHSRSYDDFAHVCNYLASKPQSQQQQNVSFPSNTTLETKTETTVEPINLSLQSFQSCLGHTDERMRSSLSGQQPNHPYANATFDFPPEDFDDALVGDDIDIAADDLMDDAEELSSHLFADGNNVDRGLQSVSVDTFLGSNTTVDTPGSNASRGSVFNNRTGPSNVFLLPPFGVQQSQPTHSLPRTNSAVKFDSSFYRKRQAADQFIDSDHFFPSVKRTARNDLKVMMSEKFISMPNLQNRATSEYQSRHMTLSTSFFNFVGPQQQSHPHLGGSISSGIIGQPLQLPSQANASFSNFSFAQRQAPQNASSHSHAPSMDFSFRTVPFQQSQTGSSNALFLSSGAATVSALTGESGKDNMLMVPLSNQFFSRPNSFNSVSPSPTIHEIHEFARHKSAADLSHAGVIPSMRVGGVVGQPPPKRLPPRSKSESSGRKSSSNSSSGMAIPSGFIGISGLTKGGVNLAKIKNANEMIKRTGMLPCRLSSGSSSKKTSLAQRLQQNGFDAKLGASVSTAKHLSPGMRNRLLKDLAKAPSSKQKKPTSEKSRNNITSEG